MTEEEEESARNNHPQKIRISKSERKNQAKRRRAQGIVAEIEAERASRSSDTRHSSHFAPFRYVLSAEQASLVLAGLNSNTLPTFEAIFSCPHLTITDTDVYTLTARIRVLLTNAGISFATQLETFLNSHVHPNHPEHHLPRNYVSILREYFILCGFSKPAKDGNPQS